MPGPMAPTAGPPDRMRMMLLMSRLQQAIALLRNDIKRGFRINIETDTMISGDVQQERGDAVEFIKGVGGFLTQAAEIGKSDPGAAKLLGKILQFAVRKFRTGRDVESTIDEYVEDLSKRQKNPQAAKPDPETVKAQAEIARIQMEAETQRRNDERQAQIETRRIELQMAEQKQEHDARMAQIAREAEVSVLEHRLRLQELNAKLVADKAAATPAVGIMQ